MLGKIEGKRREGKRIRRLDGITDSIDISSSKFQEIMKGREAWHAAVHEVAKCQTRLSNWTRKSVIFSIYRCNCPRKRCACFSKVEMQFV